MKKIYQNPTMRIVKVQPMQMIAQSQRAIGNEYKENDVVLSKRRRGIFQDDASEEDQSIW